MRWNGESIPKQHHARLQRLHDECADHRAGDRADAAGKRRAADDRGCDRVELVELALRVSCGVEAGRRDRRGDGAEHAHQHEDLDGDPAGLDPRQFGCLRIAPERKDIAAEAQASGDECHDDADGDGDQHGDGDTVRDEQAAVRPGDAVGVGIFASNVDRPVIVVGDRHRADHQDAAEDAEEIFGPDRAQRKAEALALACAS